MSFSTDSSRMYAALRCIETELKKSRPSAKRLREIMAEAGRELRPKLRALDLRESEREEAIYMAGGEMAVRFDRESRASQ